MCFIQTEQICFVLLWSRLLPNLIIRLFIVNYDDVAKVVANDESEQKLVVTVYNLTLENLQCLSIALFNWYAILLVLETRS